MSFANFGFAYLVYFYGSKTNYDGTINAMKSSDGGYLYLAAYIFSRLVNFLNFYPMQFKGEATKSGEYGMENQYIYKVKGENAPTGDVILESEGTVGNYNRANRTTHHFAENSISIPLSAMLAGQVFPFPVFIYMCLIFVGRIAY